MKLDPVRLTFNQITPDSGPQHQAVKITRGDGGPINPEVVPLENENIKTSLREIQAGEQYELDVELVPPWPHQVLNANLVLKTGIPEAPQDTIRVYARVMPRLTVEGYRFRIPANMTSDTDLRLRLKWAGGSPGKVLEVDSSDPQLPAHVEEDRGQQFVVLHVPADYKMPEGQRATVTLKTDDAQAPTLKIPVQAPPPAPRARVMPSRLTIPPESTTDLDLTARIVWSDGPPGKILEASASDPKLSVRVEEQNNEQVVTVHAPAGYAPTTPMSPSVTIKTDDAKMPVLRIPIYVPRPVARLRAVPSRFTVPQNAENELDLKSLLLWSDEHPGRILEATCSDPKTRVSVEDQGERAYVVLHVPGDYTPPTDPRPVVTVKTDDPKMPSLEIPVFVGRMPRHVMTPTPRNAIGTEIVRPKSGDIPPPAPSTAPTASPPGQSRRPE